LILVFNSFLFSCTTVEVIGPESDSTLDIKDQPTKTVGLNFDLYMGNIGFILVAREIYRKGYSPDKATISFQDIPKYNTVIEIDKWTNTARFEIPVDSLTENELNSFNNGVIMNIEIEYNDTNLVSFQDNWRFDENIQVLNLDTDKEAIKRPMPITDGTPYLIRWKKLGGLLRRDLAVDIPNWFHSEYSTSSTLTGDDGKIFYDFKYYFYSTGENKFKIRYGEAVLSQRILDEYPNFKGGWWGLKEDDDSNNGSIYRVENVDESEAATFELIEYEDGNYSLRLVDSSYEKVNNTLIKWFPFGNKLVFDESNYGRTPDQFKLLADINWEVETLGVEYQQAVLGPTKLDFAFRSTLSNCSSATLTEQVGRVETKSSTTSVALTESIQMFASQKQTEGVTLDFTIGASSDLYGFEATEKLGYSFEVETTSSITSKNEIRTYADEVNSVEVSRVRTINLPPFTVVEVYDVVRSVENAYSPFIVKMKMSGISPDSGLALTGEEILFHLQNNYFDGIITEVNDNSILFTLSGTTQLDNIFESSTGAREILGECD
tara:strand:+ start:717 stop:2360 length:1644 start_codon:yes stop_codon:yes gene_type:complete